MKLTTVFHAAKGEYFCEDCGEWFDRPECGKEYSEYWGVGGYTEYSCCPYCNSGNYIDIGDYNRFERLRVERERKLRKIYRERGKSYRVIAQ